MCVSSVGFGSGVVRETSRGDAGQNRLPSGSSEPACHWSDSALGIVLPVLGLELFLRLGAAWSGLHASAPAAAMCILCILLMIMWF